jgi:hypothetical protein
MSVTTGIRFRPVEEKGHGSERARSAARERWQKRLKDWPGVTAVRFVAPHVDPPVEREEVRRLSSHVPVVDITVEWETKEHADTLFLNSELCMELYGLVAGAPAVRIVGEPEVNGTPAEIPKL